MDTFDFFVLHNPKVFDSQDTSALPVFFLSDVFFGNTAGDERTDQAGYAVFRTKDAVVSSGACYLASGV